jgi:glycosyltransferase involved in cell wall biosynthesis
MSNNPLISVVMNCYNCSEYLNAAIDSVYLQTYTNWEIIFIDNGSSDCSYKIADQYDSKLSIYRIENNIPLYEARNYALSKCNGEYIAFLDCDDLWVYCKLYEQVNVVNKGACIVYTGYDLIDGNNKKIGEFSNNLPNGKITNSLLLRNSISIGSILIKSNILNRYKFNPYYELIGDFELWIRLSLEYNFNSIPLVLEHSRRHEFSTSNRLKDRWIKESRFFYIEMLQKGFAFAFKHPSLFFYIVKNEIRGLLRAIE